MYTNWNNTTPIHEQLRDRAAAMILDGSIKPGEPLPSIQSAAVDLRVNPVIVARAYAALVSENVVQDRRETGMFVVDDASRKLLAAERKRFVREKWPAVLEEMKRLDLEPAALAETGKFQ